jgi:hypothetical protein
VGGVAGPGRSGQGGVVLGADPWCSQAARGDLAGASSSTAMIRSARWQRGQITPSSRRPHHPVPLPAVLAAGAGQFGHGQSVRRTRARLGRMVVFRVDHCRAGVDGFRCRGDFDAEGAQFLDGAIQRVGQGAQQGQGDPLGTIADQAVDLRGRQGDARAR